MSYEVIFDISKSDIVITTHALLGFFFIGIFIIMPLCPEIFFRFWPSKVWATRFAILGLICSILWTALVVSNIFISQRSAKNSYQSGNFQIVEGIVENFDPMPARGHKMESFTVNGVKFEYSDFAYTPGFHNATSRGGPIKNGLAVRISYVGNIILKLEVEKNSRK